LQRSLSEPTNSFSCLEKKRSWLSGHDPLDQLQENMRWQVPVCTLNPVSQYRLFPGLWFLKTQTHDLCCAHHLDLKSSESSSWLPLDFSNSTAIKEVLDGPSRLQITRTPMGCESFPCGLRYRKFSSSGSESTLLELLDLYPNKYQLGIIDELWQ